MKTYRKSYMSLSLIGIDMGKIGKNVFHPDGFDMPEVAFACSRVFPPTLKL